MIMYFTADTHFGSEKTLELSKRPFESVKEMDKTIINNWNSIIKQNDKVFHLGDFGDLSISKYLNGEIHLIKGNYDIEKNIYDCFHTVYDYYLLYLNHDVQTKWLLVHEPIKYCHKYREIPDLPINIDFGLFGHIHKLQMVKKNALNVGVDCHNFKPLSLEDVLWYKNAIDNFYDENVFI